MNKIQSPIPPRGFTLLELLIVIAIIVILSTVLVVTINPAETLRKSRDSQRISDLASLKTALGLYITSGQSPVLDNNQAVCFRSGDSNARIAYSKASDSSVTCTNSPNPGTDADGTFASNPCYFVSTANFQQVDGTGWIPVNFSSLTSGSPISSLPVDPVNTISTITAPTDSDLVYRYACQQSSSNKPAPVFELNARLESALWGPGGTDDKAAKAGGMDPNLYAVGTDLKLIGAGATSTPPPPPVGNAYQTAVLNTSGLVSYWKFDEGSGTTVSDSKDSNTGTWNGSGTHWTTGKEGSYAGSFNTGTNDYVTLNLAGLPYGSSPRTIEMWVNLASAPSYYWALIYGSPGITDEASFIAYNNYGVYFGGYGDDISYNFDPSYINQWMHVVGTYDGTTANLYLNGVLVAGPTSKPSWNTVQNVAYMGTQDGSGSFNGALDEVAIYNRALSANEVLAHYNAR